MYIHTQHRHTIHRHTQTHRHTHTHTHTHTHIGEGNGNPLQYPCLGNTMDRGPWQATVHGVTNELDMT